MLYLDIERFGFGNDSTLGNISLSDPDDPWICYSCEDERREVKVPGETCIPVGTYEILLRTDSEKFAKYYDRFDFHRGMLWLQDVPGFKWIYIHIGNKETHTDGCILPGVVPLIMPDGEFQVARSEAAYVPLYKRVIANYDMNKRVFARVTERQTA